MGWSLSRLRVAGAAALSAVAALCLAAPARAQMAVYDAAVHAETSQNLARTIDLLNTTNQQLQQVTSLSSVMGKIGAAASNSGLATTLRTLDQAMAPPRLSFSGWDLPRELQQPNLGTMSAATDFVQKSLLASPDPKTQTYQYGDLEAAKQRRILAFQNAAADGYALALQQRSGIQAAFERVASLDEQATSAQTVIDEIRVTNRLLAAIAGELVAQRELTAARLAVASSDAMATQPVLFTSPVSASATASGARASGDNGPLGQ